MSKSIIIVRFSSFKIGTRVTNDDEQITQLHITP
jgi:hypothetical protein